MAEHWEEMIEGLRQAAEGLQNAVSGLARALDAARPSPSRRTRTVVVTSVPDREQIVSIKQVARALTLNPETIKRMSARGDFPKPLALPIRKFMFLRSDLDAFWRDRLGGQDGSRFPVKPIEPGDREGRTRRARRPHDLPDQPS